MHKLIIAGSRDFNDYQLLKNSLKKKNISCIISGMARGADSLGVRYAKEHNIPLVEVPAKWDLYGKSAGYKRNLEMAEMATACICFWDGQSKGTAHMIDIAKKKNLLLKVVRYKGGEIYD